MERGSFCYFCGTGLSRLGGDDDGACFECPGVSDRTPHWRWNEDTEMLQLYVAGEKCPYCGTVIPGNRGSPARGRDDRDTSRLGPCRHGPRRRRLLRGASAGRGASR